MKFTSYYAREAGPMKTKVRELRTLAQNYDKAEDANVQLAK